jgi:dihydroorotate dehydrogenase (fumarate)
VKEYLKLIESSKKATGIPIIASVNCITADEWPKFVKNFESAGADGIELNIAMIPFDPKIKNKDVEDTYTNVVEEVKKYVNIPVSVKIGVMFNNTVRMVHKLSDLGVDAVVLFNRFYRPDIDIEEEKVIYGQGMSSPVEMGQSLRWVSILAGKIKCDIAANTGLHTHEGVIKQLLAGAAATQVCTTLYLNEIPYLQKIIQGLEDWMKRKNYNSISDFKGKISQDYRNVVIFERVQFMKRDFEE